MNEEDYMEKEQRNQENDIATDENQDIESIIALLDGKVEAGVSRICLNVSENHSYEHPKDGENIKEEYHHGRCDVGSPWAKGTVRNFDC